MFMCNYFFFQAEDGIRDDLVTGVQTCALPIYRRPTIGTSLFGCRPRRGNYRVGARRKYQIETRTPRSSRKPRAACHSWFFLYCANEKAPEDPAGHFEGRKQGRKSGTARAYS